MTLEEFLDKLEGVRPGGNGYVALCPAHDDREASLGVTEADNGLLVTCYAGCQTSDVLEALGLTFRDLFFDSVNYAEPEAIYSYTDEVGEELFQCVRFPGKKFRQRQYLPGHAEADPEGWVRSLGDDERDIPHVRRVLYRLPEVLQAVREGRTIYVCEGEKDVEALRAAGKVATCNPMGAGKWKPEHKFYVPLTGANVVIVADRDEAGRKHAETIKQSLQGVAKGVWIVQAKHGKDAADHLAAGFSVEQFVPLRQPVRRGIITAREMAERALEDLELRENDIPAFQPWETTPLVFRAGRMYALGAYTGDGKTSAALQATRKLAGEGKRGGYFSLEMPERDLRNKLIAHRGIPLRLTENPWLLKADPVTYAGYGEAVAEIGSWDLDVVFDTGMNAQKVAEVTRDREYDFVVIDHVHRFGWASDRKRLTEQVIELTNLAIEQNVMLLVLCQLRKYQRGKDLEVYPRPTKDDFRETSQIADDSSMALALWRQRDASGMTYTGATQLIVLKNRHTTGPGDQAGTVFFPTFDPAREMFVPGGEFVPQDAE